MSSSVSTPWTMGRGSPAISPGRGEEGPRGCSLITQQPWVAPALSSCRFLYKEGGPLQKAFPDAPSLPPLRARPCWASCKLLGELGTCLDPTPALHPGFSQFSLHHENGSRCLVSACTHAVRRAPTSLADAVPACPDHAVRKHGVTWHHRLTEEPEAHSPAGMTALTPAPSVSSRSAGECSSGAFGCSAQARRCQAGPDREPAGHRRGELRAPAALGTCRTPNPAELRLRPVLSQPQQERPPGVALACSLPWSRENAPPPGSFTQQVSASPG